MEEFQEIERFPVGDVHPCMVLEPPLATERRLLEPRDRSSGTFFRTEQRANAVRLLVAAAPFAAAGITNCWL